MYTRLRTCTGHVRKRELRFFVFLCVFDLEKIAFVCVCAFFVCMCVVFFSALKRNFSFFPPRNFNKSHIQPFSEMKNCLLIAKEQFFFFFWKKKLFAFFCVCLCVFLRAFSGICTPPRGGGTALFRCHGGIGLGGGLFLLV